MHRIKVAADPEGFTENLKSKIQKGKVVMPDQKFTAESKLIFSFPDKCRVETEFNSGQKNVQIVNGEKAWEIKDGKTRELKGQELNYLIFNIRLDSFMSDWKKLFRKVSLEKEEAKVNNKSCYVLKCIPADKYDISTDVVFYIDKQSYLVVKTIMSAYSKAGVLRETVTVGKYRKKFGVMVPVVTETNILGARIIYKITDIRFNPPIDKYSFNP
ncbi:MAG: outer membrane lipoprotein-sorting protein [Victivallales bacterium]|nr:outer membrane lipoprotein-sorting protein [Victivallales bacterium]MCF7888700.1 outer membrane lipoprotein-sorting protein [Victivallales bacterium]